MRSAATRAERPVQALWCRLAIAAMAALVLLIIRHHGYQGLFGFHPGRPSDLDIEVRSRSDRSRRQAADRTLALRRLRAWCKAALRRAVPDVTEPPGEAALYPAWSAARCAGAGRSTSADMVEADPDLIGQTARPCGLMASDDIDSWSRAHRRDVPESERRSRTTRSPGSMSSGRTAPFEDHASTPVLFAAGDSREPELAGIWGAVVGSLLTLAVTCCCRFPGRRRSPRSISRSSRRRTAGPT